VFWGSVLVNNSQPADTDTVVVYVDEGSSVAVYEDGQPVYDGAARVGEAVDTGASAPYEYEPGEAEILATLLPRNISVQVFRALLENAASEQGARMSSMDNATRNAGEMIKKQTIIYNRSRQAMITKELIEIISGAEAL
jgi:F-type H+-transporting ATPase subunit gamma